MTVLRAELAVFRPDCCTECTGKTEQFSEDEHDEEDETPDSLCCLEGCLTGAIAAFLFLIVIPAGIILCVYATNTDSQSILAVGITLIVTPIISVPVFIAIVLNRRRLKRLGKNQVAVGGVQGTKTGTKKPEKY